MKIAISGLTLTFITASMMKVSWEGNRNWKAWVFINGVYYAGPLTHIYESKSVYVPIDQTGVTHIEIHEAESGDTVNAIELPHEDKPWIYWSPVSVANEYWIYYREASESTYKRLMKKAHETSATFFSKQVGRDLDRWGGKYYWFRVVSVKSNLIKSSTTAWPRFLKGLPNKPTDATVTQTGSTMKLTITA